MLAGCIASVAFSDLNRATIRLLTRNGIEVLIPEHQRCCGALQVHAGYRQEARHLARKNIRAMEGAEFDAIITNAAGCGAAMKAYSELLHKDEDYGPAARDFVRKIKDVTEYLAAIGLRPPNRKLNARVTYQDPCHLAHGQGIRSGPRELLRQAGAELVETAHPDACCGSAGVYNVVENELSMKVLDAKMDELQSARADIIASANVGCMLQLRAGVAQRGMKTRVAHVVELLNESYVDSERQPRHRRRNDRRD
jgi:glycolate oxidase iron-sulfur subunit